MLNNVMPKRGVFFELLASHTQRVVSGANATLRLISGLGPPNADNAAAIEEVHAYKQSADLIKADLIRLLYESFTTPINRDQLHTLTLDLDRVLDGLRGVANGVGTFRIDTATGEARAMASLCADACMRLHRATVALADKDRSRETMDLCQEIDRIESKADKLRQKAIRRIFEEEGDDEAVWRAIRMQELYTLLEAAIDACKRAGKTIEEILLENA
jgi:uncharacterized protein